MNTRTGITKILNTLFLILLLCSCASNGDQTKTVEVEQPTHTKTPLPNTATFTPIPSDTPQPTVTPTNTQTPEPLYVITNSNEEEKVLATIIDAFLVEAESTSLDDWKDIIENSPDYIEKFFFVFDYKHNSVELIHDVVLLGTYWIKGYEYEETKIDIQILVLYCPQLDRILKGIVSVQEGDQWSEVPTIMKDNAIDLAKQGEKQIKLNFDSQKSLDEWISTHRGHHLTTSWLLYYDSVAKISSDDRFSTFQLPILMQDYILQFTRRHPNTTVDLNNIDRVLSTTEQLSQGVVLIGISPQNNLITPSDR